MCTPMPNGLQVCRDFSFPFFFETDVNQKYPLPISQNFRERANPLASSFRAERTMHFFPAPSVRGQWQQYSSPTQHLFKSLKMPPEMLSCSPGGKGQGVNSQKAELIKGGSYRGPSQLSVRKDFLSGRGFSGDWG